jgi:hypothetical protein
MHRVLNSSAVWGNGQEDLYIVDFKRTIIKFLYTLVVITNKMLWSTVSNAFFKSQNIAIAWFFSLRV